MSVSSKGSVAISVNPGNTATGSDELTLTTNCSSGYVVYASATSSSEGTSLSNGSSEISASSNTLASPGSLGDNTWGIANASNYAEGKFAGLPTYANYNVTALTSGDSSASASRIPVYYGVKVSSDITPGTYTGNVLYTAMVNSACSTYTITFNGNGGTTSDSKTTTTQELPLSDSTALTVNAFTRSGYKFLGWSESSSATSATFSDGQSVTSSDFTLTDGAVTLYAVWQVLNEFPSSLTTMQGMTDAICSAASVGAKATLTDVRDNSDYTVEKLVDGKCWMTQNLRIVNKELDSSTSNISSDSSNYSYKFTVPASDLNDSGFTTSNKTDTDKAAVYYNDNTTYGAYYNFYTATAGYSYYADSKNSSAGSAPYDICPKNWRLPIGGSGGEFVALDKAANTHDTNAGANRDTVSGSVAADVRVSFQNLTIPAGSVKTDGYPGLALAGNTYVLLDGIGWYANYWTSTIAGLRDGSSLSLDSSEEGARYITPQDTSPKYYGNSVRCVQEQPSYTIAYNANGGTGSVPTSGTYAGTTGSIKSGSTATLATYGTLAKSGYTFQGWSTSSSAATLDYAGGEKLIPVDTLVSQTGTSRGDTINLYAVWKKNPTNYTTESACTSAGGKFLKDNKCWKMSDTTATWANRDTLCTGNWTVPSTGDYDALLVAYGGTDYSGGKRRNDKYPRNGDLYTALGLSGLTRFWSSQAVASYPSGAFYLYVNSSASGSGYDDKTISYRVLCLAS